MDTSLSDMLLLFYTFKLWICSLLQLNSTVTDNLDAMSKCPYTRDSNEPEQLMEQHKPIRNPMIAVYYVL